MCCVVHVHANDDFIDVVRYDAASITLLSSVFNENKMQFTTFSATDMILHCVRIAHSHCPRTSAMC